MGVLASPCSSLAVSYCNNDKKKPPRGSECVTLSIWVWFTHQTHLKWKMLSPLLYLPPRCTTVLVQYTLLLPKNRAYPNSPEPPNRRDLDSTRWAVTSLLPPVPTPIEPSHPRPFQETISVNRCRTISTIDPINQTNPTCHQSTKHEYSLSPLRS